MYVGVKSRFFASSQLPLAALLREHVFMSPLPQSKIRSKEVRNMDMKWLRQGMLALALTGAIVGGGAALASAQTDSSSSTSSDSSSTAASDSSGTSSDSSSSTTPAADSTAPAAGNAQGNCPNM